LTWRRVAISVPRLADRDEKALRRNPRATGAARRSGSVEEDDGHGGKRRSSVAKDSGRGMQGAPISPLLSNLSHEALRAGLETVRPREAARSASGGLCRLFRDPVSRNSDAGKGTDQRIMTALKLRVNEKKTRIARVPEEPLLLPSVRHRYPSCRRSFWPVGTSGSFSDSNSKMISPPS
jgi:hypothetical protein